MAALQWISLTRCHFSQVLQVTVFQAFLYLHLKSTGRAEGETDYEITQGSFPKERERQLTIATNYF